VDVVSARGVLDWLTAFGTVGAVLVALIVAGAEYYRTKRDRDRAQASLVTAWISTVEDFSANPTRILAMYTVHNGSTAPVFEFVATLPRWYLGGPEEKITNPVMIVPTKEPMYPWPDPEEVAVAGDVALRITFRDGAGMWWERADDGRLRRLWKPPSY